MHQDEQAPARLRWARLRFSIIGQLLASPPETGDLASRIDELARTSWKHPTTGEALRFSSKTIERMYYAARGQEDPLGALERKVPKHAGTHPSVSPALAAALTCQYQAPPALELSTPSRQPCCPGEGGSVAGPDGELWDGVPFHEGPCSLSRAPAEAQQA